MTEQNPELVTALLTFISDEMSLPKALTTEYTILNTTATVWWSSVDMSGQVCPELCQMAKSLLKMPSSSASIERIFSNFGSIQNKLRNKLGIAKCAKLVLCYRMLRGKKDIDW